MGRLALGRVLTVIATSLLVPFEVFQLIEGASLLKATD